MSDQVNQHVVLVRYTGHQSPHEEWVYNSADIDGQDVIWAHNLGPSRNPELIRYYKDRKIWLLEPDTHGAGAPTGSTFAANRAKKVKYTERTWEVPLESTKAEKKVLQNHPKTCPK